MSPAERKDREALADRLRAPGVAALYLPALVLGDVRHVFAAGEFADSKGNAIDAPVVLLSTGDSFLVDPSTLVLVEGAALAFYAELTRQLSDALKAAVANAGDGVDLPDVVRLTRAALVAQKRALDLRSEEPRG